MMNFFTIVARLGQAEQLLVELANLGVLEADAVALKAAIQDDLAELKAGTLTLVKLDTLQAAAKLLGDVGGLVGRIGSLTGNVKLIAVGGALTATLGTAAEEVQEIDLGTAAPLPASVDNGEDKPVEPVAAVAAEVLPNQRPGSAGRP